jgi:hypothetical protein
MPGLISYDENYYGESAIKDPSSWEKAELRVDRGVGSRSAAGVVRHANRSMSKPSVVRH